jgi:hypothetical protein
MAWIRARRTLWCDNRTCTARVHHDTARHARALARARGWRLNGGHDWCPIHIPDDAPPSGHRDRRCE